ncbi:MAG: HAMP domain-containing sensor histidine kinase [Chloroflexota bacterium]
MANDDLQLLHNFIHDLKAPLSSAKSFIDLISASGELSNEQKHFAHRAQTNLSRMNRIIGALLEYARMEANDEPLELEICDLLEVIESVTNDLEGNASERNLTFHINVDPDAQFVQADDYLLQSVVQNLVSNAIKYNRTSGKIYVSTVDAGEYIAIAIKDTGLGIPEEAIDRIFDQFYRVETKAHQIVEGTGIGLAMVRTIVARHGGEIAVESEMDKGSTFTFTMPRANTSSPDYDREPLDGLPDEFQEEHDTREDHDSGEVLR